MSQYFKDLQKTTQQETEKIKELTREEKRIFSIPADRRCPKCLRIYLKSRQWVISYDHGQTICRSCFMRK